MSLFDFMPGSTNFPVIIHRYVIWVNQNFPAGSCWRIIRILLICLYRLGVYLSVITRKIQIEEHTSIGSGLRLSPGGEIIIGAKQIGNNCKVHHNVTIGLGFSAAGESGHPVIGNNVIIESDSIIYGSIRLGDGVVVKEGSVVSA